MIVDFFCSTEGERCPLAFRKPTLAQYEVIYFAWRSFGEFLKGVEAILEDNRELGCSFICIQ